MIRIGLQFFAHKKGVGSTKNGRDSESKRLGPKRADGQHVPGRQYPGPPAGHTPTFIPVSTWARAATIPLFATANGVVRFERLGKDRKQVFCLRGVRFCLKNSRTGLVREFFVPFPTDDSRRMSPMCCRRVVRQAPEACQLLPSPASIRALEDTAQQEQLLLRLAEASCRSGQRSGIFCMISPPMPQFLLLYDSKVKAII